MLTGVALTEELTREFPRSQAVLLSKIITESYTDLVKTNDFNELKEIVRDLALAQNRTEKGLEELRQAQVQTANGLEALRQAQNRTEKGLDELRQAQNRSEARMDELTAALVKLTETVDRNSAELSAGLRATRSELAGLSKSFGYSLENEAYRSLPTYLEREHGITVNRRFIREYIGDREINLLAEGTQGGEPVLIVGESKVQLGVDDFVQLQENMAAVRQAQEAGELPNYRILPLLITHMARPTALRRAEREGVLVIQSFEW